MQRAGTGRAGTGRQEVLGRSMQAPGSSDPGHYEGPCSLKQHVQARSPPKSDWTNLRSTSNKRSLHASARKRKLSEEGKQKLILNIPQARNTFHLHPRNKNNFKHSTSNKHIPLASAHKRRLSEEGKQKIILNIPQARSTFHLHPRNRK